MTKEPAPQPITADEVKTAEAKPRTTLYDLLDEKCTGDQLSDLLREFKATHPKEVMFSGSKPDLLERVQRLVGQKIVPLDRVLELLRESEENGDQHVFYLRAKNEEVLAKCRDRGDHFASSLWGEEYDHMGFPQFDRTPSSYVWADFRIGLPGKPQDWLAKIYGHEVHDRFKNQIRDARGDLVRYYVRVEDRPVCVVRWNDPDLLELRIPRAQNLGTVAQRLETVWEMIQPAFAPTDFEAWEMDAVRKGLLNKRAEEEWQQRCRLSSMEFLDSSSGKASFLPNSDDENADDAEERASAIEAYLTGNSNCLHLVCTWLPGASAGKLKSELKTVSGGKNTNELAVAAKTTFAAIDYVTTQLRQLDRP